MLSFVFPLLFSSMKLQVPPCPTSWPPLLARLPHSSCLLFWRVCLWIAILRQMRCGGRFIRFSLPPLSSCHPFCDHCCDAPVSASRTGHECRSGGVEQPFSHHAGMRRHINLEAVTFPPSKALTSSFGTHAAAYAEAPPLHSEWLAILDAEIPQSAVAPIEGVGVKL